MSGPPSSALRTSLLFDVFALGQATRRLLAEAMADGPLSPEDYAIYSAIFEAESIGPSGLAARLGMPLTTLMDHLARIEGRADIGRMANARDRRATTIVLTARGLSAHREANRHFERAYAALLSALPSTEAAAQNALAEIRSAVDSAAAALQPAGPTSATQR